MGCCQPRSSQEGAIRPSNMAPQETRGGRTRPSQPEEVLQATTKHEKAQSNEAERSVENPSQHAKASHKDVTVNAEELRMKQYKKAETHGVVPANIKFQEEEKRLEADDEDEVETPVANKNDENSEIVHENTPDRVAQPPVLAKEDPKTIDALEKPEETPKPLSSKVEENNNVQIASVREPIVESEKHSDKAPSIHDAPSPSADAEVSVEHVVPKESTEKENEKEVEPEAHPEVAPEPLQDIHAGK